MRLLFRVVPILCLVSLLTAGYAAAQDEASAKRFVESLYRHYTKNSKGIDFTGSKGLNYFSPSLNALMDADAKAIGPDEVGVLDGDPVCSCQDWEGIFDLNIAVRMLSNNRANAAVSFALFAPKAGADRDRRSLEMTLISGNGQWRIDNIIDRSNAKAPFDLRAELAKEIRGAKRASQAK